MPRLDLLTLANKTSCTGVTEGLNVSLITKACGYYHYCCDGFDDQGWGCGYRTLQSLCSCYSPGLVPSLKDIQNTLVEVGDKPRTFLNSKEWIGCVEASIVLDQLFHVVCKLIHVASGTDVARHLPELHKHFQTIGSPIMIGGNIDGVSKTLIGIADTSGYDLDQTLFLIADPHYNRTDGDNGTDGEDVLIKTEYVKWHRMKLFDADSFYNFCLPLTQQ